jgi:EAL domain-containing protein (putative c-di-GMP-specific phosphodiesterase class I)
MQSWPRDLRVSFNLSARSLASPDAMLRILNLLQGSGIDHRRIEFEVTETALMIDFEATVRALQLLRNLGCSVALDDFGTGYSSLSYVQKLPLDKIKIDRRFISEITLNQKTREIVQTMLDLAKNLNLICVAEGVETRDQADMLAAMGCRQMQGFLFSVPVSSQYVPSLLAKREAVGSSVSF